MTNHWADLQNAKVFLIEGSNAAENHAMAMRWIRKAQERGRGRHSCSANRSVARGR